MKIKVMVVDDSAFMRKILTDVINQDPGLEVVGTARDGVEALEVLERLRPDVVTLDITMPRKDGLETLKEIMARRPLPVLMVSGLTWANASSTIEALRLGAVDFLGKPARLASLDAGFGREVREKVRVCANARLSPGKVTFPVKGSEPVKGGAPETLVALAASTGGPAALHEVIPRLPGYLDAGFLVVQHMPPGFTRSLAQRLDQLSVLRVREAEAGDSLSKGDVLVAPGGFHMVVDGAARVSINRGPPQHGVRPAADVTMISAANAFGRNTVGVVLTGMGSDGTRGLEWIKKAGGRTLAQDEATSVVHGMPGSAIRAGCVDEVVPLGEVAKAIEALVDAGRGGRRCGIGYRT